LGIGFVGGGIVGIIVGVFGSGTYLAVYSLFRHAKGKHE